MSDNRMWRVRFLNDSGKCRSGEFWFQDQCESSGHKTDGHWQCDKVRFTSFTTEEAHDVPWTKVGQVKSGAEDPAHGANWIFEYIGTRIPIADDDSL